MPCECDVSLCPKAMDCHEPPENPFDPELTKEPDAEIEPEAERDRKEIRCLF